MRHSFLLQVLECAAGASIFYYIGSDPVISMRNPSVPSQTNATLGEFLRRQQREIFSAWEARIRRTIEAGGMDRSALIDHLPDLLAKIADIVDQAPVASTAAAKPVAEKHALIRLQEGFDLGQVVHEYAVLRDCVAEIWERSAAAEADAGLRAFHRAIDEAIAAAVDSYIRARNRTLEALDRISTSALQSTDLEELLRCLLGIFRETTLSVDTAAILLRDGNTLRVRAAVGSAADPDMEVSIGEGFEGTIALSRKPLLISDAQTDPLAKDSLGRGSNVRALYGVPLLEGSELIGVARIGSLTADDFSEQDKHLFIALANRATSTISHHLLTSQRQEFVQHLQQSEERFRALIENSADAIALFDEDANFIYLSPSTALLLGYDPEELIGVNGLNIVHPEDHPRAGEMLRDALKVPGASVIGELRLRHKDGRWRWIELRARNLLHLPSVRAIVGNYHDVTSRKEADQRLHEEDQRKNDFLAVLGHELRNPLGPIRNAVHILRALSPDQPQVRQAQEIIERQVQQMVRLIDDLLDVSRITRGKILLRREPVDLVACVRTTVEDHRAELEAKGQRLSVDLPSNAVGVIADPARLSQVLGNLLQNSYKFTPAGGRVQVTVRQEASTAQVSVRDSGIGMDSATLANAFEPFTQATAGDRENLGLGLGLALVKGLVELHGGTVEATSEGVNQGTEVTIRLPVAYTARKRAEVETAPDTPQRVQVLLIEDNVDGAESLRLLLELSGHKVEIAHTGRDGIRAAHRGLPDVVLCDIALPDMTGYEVARELRLDPVLGPVRLIALTGFGQDEDRRRALEAGFENHLTKPVDPEALVAAISARR